jgi:hypothetical protein
VERARDALGATWDVALTVFLGVGYAVLYPLVIVVMAVVVYGAWALVVSLFV